MLGNFLGCRERFRIKYVLGLRPAEDFSKNMEYGQMFHLCEESFAAGTDWVTPLQDYAKSLCKKFPLAQEQISKCYNVCRVQFPIYVDFWKKNPGRRKVVSLLQEQVFDVPYELPSGRVVRLRGKWDGVSLVGKGKGAGIYLDEHKTKGDPKAEQIQRQLTFDMQTMIYLIALQEYAQQVRTMARNCHNGFTKQMESVASKPIQGVCYNVIRRPLSGGKHSIRPHKATTKKAAETIPEYYERLGGLIAEEPEHYFHRFTAKVSKQDIENFKRQFLHPVLENLQDDYEWFAFCLIEGEDHFDYLRREKDFPHHRQRTYRQPFGTWNVLDEGGATELDEYIATGSTAGLERSDRLFKELD